MRKGENTKLRIIAQSAELLNRKGYLHAPVSEIMEATGLKKGGIYNHFESKEDLAREALSYAVQLLGHRLKEALSAEGTVTEKVLRFMQVSQELLLGVPIPGGCPVMNAAVEADDTSPELRELAKQAMDRMVSMVQRTLQDGIASGELKPELDTEALASVIVATMEGALMMSRLHGNDHHLRIAARHITGVLHSACLTS
ncbi:TetR/AcrR family transcriptional regulator [Paenibacillus silviterrae]|uniref:TetR/AcrR family transcriptional regulator n=1 Tax=Paenibacillus silviterrae TaxID=3242194 RepID=UPI00254320BE|nr:TetR/AcrR family transcriptional regulator [Paenibacillus chinjuensis]